MEKSKKIDQKELKKNREKYKEIYWVSKDKTERLVTDMTYEHLINTMNKIADKMNTAKKFPMVYELQEWNGIPYTTWRKIFINEYLYRRNNVQEEEKEKESNKEYKTYRYPKSRTNNKEYF